MNLQEKGGYCREIGSMVYWKHIIENKNIYYIQKVRKNMVLHFDNSHRLGGGEELENVKGENSMS